MNISHNAANQSETPAGEFLTRAQNVNMPT